MRVLLSTLCLLALALNSGFTQTTDAEASFFLSTLQSLHREPPAVEPKSRAAIQVLWMEMKLDQFNMRDTRTWKMRYMLNDEFFEDGAPLFIFVGGEWEISPSYISGGHMYDMAKEHKGLLVYTEHRFYGASKPTSDMSIENLKYLSVRQALADLAYFIETIKVNTEGLMNSKVILVGGSYSGSMVTWFKKLYPDLAVGCWASSAPLYAKVNFQEYHEVSGQSIATVGGDGCHSRIKNGIAELEDMFASKRGAEVKAMLKICNNFDENNDLDIWSLFGAISQIFGGVVQSYRKVDIQAVCNDIMKGRTDVIGLINFILKFGNPNGCINAAYDSSINGLFDSVFSPGNSIRQWFYQTCNEFGWYQTSHSSEQPYGTKFPLTLFTTICHDVYGDKITNEYIHSKVDDTNDFFGGLSPEVENVYMTHGSLDPWSAMGIRDEKRVTILEGYSHCKDLGSISIADTNQMKASKQKIAELVREWVK